MGDTKPFTIHSDGSGYTLVSVLFQREDSLNQYQLISIHRDVHEKGHAVLWTNKFSGYIDGSRIIIKTNHQALPWFLTLEPPVNWMSTLTSRCQV